MATKDAESDALAKLPKVVLPKGSVIKASGGGTIANEGTGGSI